ncbi:hypothetical protein A3B45_00355 [Candidatus Daviesbacteria bacterium RIFCSPLOWO2_01_FULL_39_12]|uniref:Class I SAM-dependent methyltransferase n=1 Tax=Candidatus Daviesbacteria bacterium RIFCSPLOWO2_01_FULL_39_12 TaxID=1797785 RepID=A0A1F5KNY0_9BACT|nr:MAG: hypothetical protein A3B45_00355 [Candidatus Daviesbacteria bacterium RIFCSPLOWO2_01_FULL_39_12]
MKITKLVKYSFLYELINPIIQFQALIDWYIQGKMPPTPRLIKQAIIKRLAAKYYIKIFIETGTYLGNMINGVKTAFEKIYTIELDKKLYKRAKNKFSTNPRISVICGNSAAILPRILNRINKPAILWLDAHYSRGITTKGRKETPIIEEMSVILNHPIKKHVILIDDADCFIGKNDYPTLKYLKTFVKSNNSSLTITVEYNMIIITPKN